VSGADPLPPPRALRVGVYVDAFNVYYGARDHCGKGTAGWRWLDLAALTRSLLDPVLWSGAVLERIVYCTAPRDREGDPSSILDQHAYIGALKTDSVPTTIVTGQYVPRIKTGDLVTAKGKRILSPGAGNIPGWLPVKEALDPGGQGHVLRGRIATFEEKGSDVNVASHLLIDALDNRVDAAVVFSNDSDLRVPLEEARLRIPVGTVNPGNKATVAALRGDATIGAGRHWWRRLEAKDFLAHQLPDPAGPHAKPAGW
jgi:hypothetical protein